MMIALRTSKMKSATSFICIFSVDNDVPVRLRRNRPIEPIRYCAHRSLQIGPVHGGIPRSAVLDYLMRRKAERVINGHITGSAQDAWPF